MMGFGVKKNGGTLGKRGARTDEGPGVCDGWSSKSRDWARAVTNQMLFLEPGMPSNQPENGKRALFNLVTAFSLTGNRRSIAHQFPLIDRNHGGPPGIKEACRTSIVGASAVSWSARHYPLPLCKHIRCYLDAMLSPSQVDKTKRLSRLWLIQGHTSMTTSAFRETDNGLGGGGKVGDLHELLCCGVGGGGFGQAQDSSEDGQVATAAGPGLFSFVRGSPF
ncbi:hypothetical protein B0T13DRAFT_505343 [Neurospora crassa]|nr:hypothetical protein B0T13DRAFT_505343 [Neurospora crassa]